MVTGGASASPVAGAPVSYSGGQATTNPAGADTSAAVTEGTYDIAASAPGYTAQTLTVTVGAGQAASKNFALAPTGVGTASGVVTDALTGSTVAGAPVSYLGGSPTTDSGGTYPLASLPHRTTTVTATRAG